MPVTTQVALDQDGGLAALRSWGCWPLALQPGREVGALLALQDLRSSHRICSLEL